MIVTGNVRFYYKLMGWMYKTGWDTQCQQTNIWSKVIMRYINKMMIFINLKSYNSDDHNW